MDLFELLILLFILAPILEGILRQKQKKQGDGIPPGTRGPRPGQSGESEGVPTPSSGDRAAEEMIPDDLWQILTGEGRGPVAAPPAEEEGPAYGTEWEDVTESEPAREPGSDWGADLREDVRESAAAREIGSGRDRPERWEPAPLPSMDTAEAYSLETEPHRPMVDEEAFVRTVPTAEVRHRRFHEKIARLRRQRPIARDRSLPLGLDDPEAVRRAIVLRTVLGPPKALE